MVDFVNEELYLTPHVKKNIIIQTLDGKTKIENDSIHWDLLEITESICSEEDLVFGSCESSSVKFVISNVYEKLIGKEIRISELLESAETEFVYGTYRVYSDTPTADRRYREVVAYDRLYDVIGKDVANWYMSLWGTKESFTLKEFRDSFFEHIGIAQKEISLINDWLVLKKTVSFDEYDGNYSGLDAKDVIKMICEINGAFGKIGRSGRFEYVILAQNICGLYPSNTIYPSDNIYPANPKGKELKKNVYKSCKYEDYEVSSIDTIAVHSEESVVNYGSGDNAYHVYDNFLIYGQDAESMGSAMKNLLGVISELVYKPFEAECVGNPCLETGDAIKFSTSREIVESYILSRTITGIQSKKDLYSANGNQKQPDTNFSVSGSIANLKNKTNNLVRTVDETRSELSDLEKNTETRFVQTADSILQEAIAREELGREVKASLELKIDNDDDGRIISLINGSANKIHFSATNMFTVDAPNIVIDYAGNVTTGGEIVGDEALYLTKGLPSVPGGVQDAIKISAIEILTGSYDYYYVSGSEIWTQSSASTLASPQIHVGSEAQVITFGEQIQAPSVYSAQGMFSDIALSHAEGTYGGRVYKCGGGYGNDGIASTGWVKNYTSNMSVPYASSAGTASYATSANSAFACQSTASQSHTANCYIRSSDMGIFLIPNGSSKRFKKDITEELSEEIDPRKLYDLKIKQYRYKPEYLGLSKDDDTSLQIGFIAEDVDKIYPVACDYDERTNEIINWKERDIIPPMLYLIQEQKKEIENLKSELKEIKDAVNNKNN